MRTKTVLVVASVLGGALVIVSGAMVYPYTGAQPMPDERSDLQVLRDQYAQRIVPGIDPRTWLDALTAMNELMEVWDPVGYTLEELEYVVGHKASISSFVYSFEDLDQVWSVRTTSPRDERPVHTAGFATISVQGFTRSFGEPPGQCDSDDAVPDAKVFDAAPESVQDYLHDLRNRYAGRIRPGSSGKEAKTSAKALEELARELRRQQTWLPKEAREYLRHMPIDVWVAIAGAAPNGAIAGYYFSNGMDQDIWGFILHCDRIGQVTRTIGKWKTRPVDVGPSGSDEDA